MVWAMLHSCATHIALFGLHMSNRELTLYSFSVFRPLHPWLCAGSSCEGGSVTADHLHLVLNVRLGLLDVAILTRW